MKKRRRKSEAEYQRDEHFAQAYMITSTSGLVYSRSMMIAATMRSRLIRGTFILRRDVARTVDDPEFMRSIRGQVPARIIDEIWERLWPNASATAAVARWLTPIGLRRCIHCKAFPRRCMSIDEVMDCQNLMSKEKRDAQEEDRIQDRRPTCL